MQTLQQHLKNIDRELARLLLEISRLAEPIRKEFSLRRGKSGTKNIFGEEQLALDKWANSFIKERLAETGMVKMLGSEEEPDIVKMKEGAEFSVTIDPLDGSSNVESNNLAGTIFGVYRDDIPCIGRKQTASLYILFGPVTTLVYSAGRGVHEFLQTDEGFFSKEADIRLPEKGLLYSVGGLRKDWVAGAASFVSWLEKEGYKLRYGGCFVGDFNQILQYGGIFSYPALNDKPKGKLRLLFETSPMAFIIEQAGGAASDGKTPILDIIPESVNQRTPLFIGNVELVKKAEEFINQ